MTLPIDPTTEPSVVYWSCEGDDTESLTHETIVEAIRARAEYDEWGTSPVRPIPEEIRVEGWMRMGAPTVDGLADRVLDDLIDHLMHDDGMTDPNGGALKATEGQQAAARVFAEAFLKDFTVWGCECVTTKTVQVSDYYPEEK